jgi:hypothetical protein
MTLAELLDLRSYDFKNSPAKLVRHAPNDRDMEAVRLGYFEEYQTIQASDIFNCDSIVSFLALPHGRALFKGTYRVVGDRPEAEEDVPKALRETIWPFTPGRIYYDLRKTNELSDLEDRLVIDWGGSERVWHQKAADQAKKKEVLEIRSPGFFAPFPGHLGVSLTYNELKHLMDKEDANPDWYHALSRTGGIYLILDEVDGTQYVGSAGGAEGIWGRWKTYAKDPTGGNARLGALLNETPDRYRFLRFSILDVLPVNTPKQERIKKEQLAKKKLGSRAFGLNLN